MSRSRVSRGEDRGSVGQRTGVNRSGVSRGEGQRTEVSRSDRASSGQMSGCQEGRGQVSAELRTGCQHRVCEGMEATVRGAGGHSTGGAGGHSIGAVGQEGTVLAVRRARYWGQEGMILWCQQGTDIVF